MDVRSIRALRRTCAGAILCLLAVVATAAGSYSSTRPGPQGLVFVRQPVLRWRIEPTGGLKVTDCSMTLNGVRVSATYSTAARALTYRPEQPLQPGQYAVECTVELDRQWKAQQKWTFSVSKDALDALPPPDEKQTEGLQAANALRRGLGLPEFELEDSLCASAQSQARFMKTNHVFGHYQKEGMPDFVGVMPIDRAQSFGHSGGVWEDVAMMHTTPAGFVKQLYNAPYHRLPYMQPGAVSFGVGFDERFSCIDFGSSPTEGFVVSPAADQAGVPTTWDGVESPSPLTVHGASGPVGYPIVCAYFTAEREALIVDSAALSGPSGDIPLWVNSAANDPELTNAIVLTPKAPLVAGVEYRASIVAHTASGQHLAKVWRFTTAP